MTDQQPVDYHYRVIARAIAEIDGPGGAQLSLDDLSARLGMSPAHFQRTFSTWVGVSPKRFQQYLTLDHARRLLADRRNMLETAHEAGLSGASRLHDLFLRWEAMSPGQFATGAAGVEMAWGRFPSPFGEVLAMGTDRGLCGLAFTDGTGFEAAFADLSGRWPAATFREAPARLEPWLTAAFTQQGEARLTLIGAPFQIKVWEALLTIPSGQVTTYTDIARAVGHPKAVRAIGTAVGRNPISFLIPCHRALRTTGALGGYHWGLPVKRAILAWEGARADELAA